MKKQLLPLRGIRTLIALCAALALALSFCAVLCIAEPGPDEATTSSSVGEDGSSLPADDDGSSASSAGEDENTSSLQESTEESTEISSDASSEASSETSTETSTDPGEETDPAYKVTLQATGEYTPEGTVTITATVEDPDETIRFTGFFFDLRYDAEALTLTNAVGEDNTVDCVTEKPGDRWENMTKESETPGTLRVAVAVSGDLSRAAEKDGTLVLTLTFTAAKEIPENTVLTVSDVIGMDGESVSHAGLGTALTLTRADEATSSASSEPSTSSASSTSSAVSSPETGDVSSFFPFLLGTGALLGLIAAIRLRRKADFDPSRK